MSEETKNEVEKEYEKWEKEQTRKRENAAIWYEYVLRHLWGERPMHYEHWMDMKEPRGGADGYAEADIWRLALRNGKITDVDVGFVKALLAIAHQLAYLRHRIEELERRIFSTNESTNSE